MILTALIQLTTALILYNCISYLVKKEGFKVVGKIREKSSGKPESTHIEAGAITPPSPRRMRMTQDQRDEEDTLNRIFDRDMERTK